MLGSGCTMGAGPQRSVSIPSPTSGLSWEAQAENMFWGFFWASLFCLDLGVGAGPRQQGSDPASVTVGFAQPVLLPRGTGLDPGPLPPPAEEAWEVRRPVPAEVARGPGEAARPLGQLLAPSWALPRDAVDTRWEGQEPSPGDLRVLESGSACRGAGTRLRGPGRRDPAVAAGLCQSRRSPVPAAPGERTFPPTVLPTHCLSPLHSSGMLAGTLPRQPERRRVAILQSPPGTCEGCREPHPHPVPLSPVGRPAPEPHRGAFGGGEGSRPMLVSAHRGVL